jgi:uncharacterized protein (TIGR02001 family)
MQKITRALLLTTLVCAAAPALAADAPAAAPAPDYTLTANVGLTSQYVYRGITQTAQKPAIQGGADFTHSSGFYLGTWGSNISWYSDNTANAANSATGNNSVSMEWDLYGGYRNTIGDVGYDVGVLQYYYPGRYVALATGVVKPDTTEVYGALSYKWVTGKVSYVASNGLFGVNNARGSYYLDLSANIPVVDTWTINAHVGEQKYTGNADPSLASNDSLYSYTDWKLGVTKDLGTGWSATAYYTDTNAKNSGYKNPIYNGGRNLGDSHFVAAVSKTF